jgi:choline kinase
MIYELDTMYGIGSEKNLTLDASLGGNTASRAKAVILLAGISSRLRPLTLSLPKSLLPIGDSTGLGLMIQKLAAHNVTSFVIVCGYMRQEIRNYLKSHFGNFDFKFVTQHNYGDSNTGYALMLAREFVEGETFVKLDGDVVFDERMLDRLMTAEGFDTTSYVCVDRHSVDDEVVKVKCDESGRLLSIDNKLPVQQAVGESIGIERIARTDSRLLFDTLATRMADPSNHKEYYEVSYDAMIARGAEFRAVDVTDLHWVEMDTPRDYEKAKRLFGHNPVPSA